MAKEAVRMIAAAVAGAVAGLAIFVGSLWARAWPRPPTDEARAKRYKKNPSCPPTPEQEPLLQAAEQVAFEPGPAAKCQITGSKRAPPSPSSKVPHAAEFSDADGGSDLASKDVEAQRTSPAQPQPKRPRGPASDIQAAPAATKHLQSDVEAQLVRELGPPKFPVPKPQGATDHSLTALLEREMGPPKFEVPKGTDAAINMLAAAPEHSKQHASVMEAVVASQVAGQAAEPVQPSVTVHLRLEVLTGPDAGKVFDTVDPAQEVHIGRLLECSLPLSNDPEVSSRHALIQYNQVDHCWKLTDIGSLNGTLLNGSSISVNRQSSPAKPLSDGDKVVFGSTTNVRVECSPSQPHTKATGPAAVRNLGATSLPWTRSAAHGSERPSTSGPLRPLVAGFGSAEPAHRQRNQSVVGGPLAVRHHQNLGMSMAVQQRVGTDHRIANTGCEDVAHWCMPWVAGQGAGQPAEKAAPLEQDTSVAQQCVLLALFDGHSGVNAAAQAKQLVPEQLQAKLGQQGLILGRPPAEQAELLKNLFLDVDKLMATDEGCTATVVLLQRDLDGSCLVQTANVGDSSAMLIQLPPFSQQPTLPGNSSPAASGEAATSKAPFAARNGHNQNPGQHARGHPPLSTAAQGGSEECGTNGSYSPAQDGSTAFPSLEATVAAGSGVTGFVGGAGPEALWLKLSEDHRISSSSKERSRLAQLGYQTVRTRLYGLNISRMLGDRFLKDEALGFLAEPYVSSVVRMPACAAHAKSPAVSHALPAGSPSSQAPSAPSADLPFQAGAAEAVQGDAHGAHASSMPAGTAADNACGGRAFLVMASDGLWDVVQEGRAASMVARAVSEEPDLSVAELATLLLSQALTLRSKDDITVMVLELH